MSTRTGIQWTDTTWNPVVGCTKVSQGCKHCYAKTIHDRRHKASLAGKKVAAQYAEPFERVQLMPDRLTAPLHWRKPRRVFVNSVSDLFHEDVPDAFIERVFSIMALADRHTFQVLTKRPARMLAWFRARQFDRKGYAVLRTERPSELRYAHPWPLPNVWLGVSVENQEAADARIPLLLQTPGAVRFLSCEPLLGPLDLHCIELPPAYNITITTPGRISALTRQHEDRYYEAPASIDWVIIGGESGPKARPCDVEWLRAVVAQCRSAEVPVFVKQLGRSPIERTNGVVTWPEIELRHSHGGNPDEWPDDLRVRQFPEARS